MLNFFISCSFQVKFRHGEAVRLEGVSGSAEGNPLLQVQEYLIIIQGAHIIHSPNYQMMGLVAIFVQRPIFFSFRLYRPNGRTWLWTGMAVFQALFDINISICYIFRLKYLHLISAVQRWNIPLWYKGYNTNRSRLNILLVNMCNLSVEFKKFFNEPFVAY